MSIKSDRPQIFNLSLLDTLWVTHEKKVVKWGLEGTFFDTTFKWKVKLKNFESKTINMLKTTQFERTKRGLD